MSKIIFHRTVYLVVTVILSELGMIFLLLTTLLVIPHSCYGYRPRQEYLCAWIQLDYVLRLVYRGTLDLVTLGNTCV